MIDPADSNWHLKGPAYTPAQVVEVAHEAFLANFPGNSDVWIGALSFDHIHRLWWVAFHAKDAKPPEPIFAVTLADDAALAIAATKSGAHEWQWQRGVT